MADPESQENLVNKASLGRRAEMASEDFPDLRAIEVNQGHQGQREKTEKQGTQGERAILGKMEVQDLQEQTAPVDLEESGVHLESRDHQESRELEAPLVLLE